MTSPAALREIAENYFRSWRDGDFETLRSLFADEVTFRGPLGSADGAEECVAGMRGMHQMITDIVVDKIFVTGDDVLTWYDLHTKEAPPMPTANWSHVENGRITEIRAVFDPRPLFAK
jgi:ketosteroid isomerase-like protein